MFEGINTFHAKVLIANFRRVALMIGVLSGTFYFNGNEVRYTLVLTRLKHMILKTDMLFYVD